MTAGTIGAAFASEAELEQSRVAIGLLVTREFHGEGNHALLGPASAFAFGAGAALALWLLSRLRR